MATRRQTLRFLSHPRSSFCLLPTHSSPCPISTARTTSLPPSIPLTPPSRRHASANAAKYKRTDTALATKKKSKTSPTFILPDLTQTDLFPLLDAIRYIRAFEVGRDPTSCKYELAVRLRTLKNGPVVRNKLRLPHPVYTDTRICVIVDRESKAGKAAVQAGATLVGEQEVFDAVKEGRMEFERCICHVDSLEKLNKAGLGRILGPRGMMPSVKLGTVVKDTGAAVKDLIGGSEYRERMGVIRLAIGQLGFTPEEVSRNIKAFMQNMKKDCAALSDRISKEVHEVVLSSTNAPGFSLSGDFKGPKSVSSAALSTQ